MYYRKTQYKIPNYYNSESQNNQNNQHNINDNINDNSKKETELKLKWNTKEYANTSDPNTWGPAFWYTLHNGAAKYPKKASEIHKKLMKNFILGIPIMLPCQACKMHAFEYIQKAELDGILDNVVSTKIELFKWFVDFHNDVNIRYNKKQISYQQAWDKYNSTKISVLSYE